jgi:hypothetical protein
MATIELTTTLNPEATNYAEEWASRGFGGPVPEQSTDWWCARTIWQSYSDRFDFLSDRRNQSSYPLPDGFGDFIQEAVKALGEAFTRLNGSDSHKVYVESEEFVMYGSPNGSHGYAYLSAWRKGK